MIKLSEITKSISPSLTRRLFNLAQNYDNVIDFTLGDPDIHPHDKIKEAGCKAILEGLDVRWGDISVVKAELLLLETASMKGPYDYYHLLSGVDLPIKSQDYIHHFFEKNKGYEFVPYSCGEANLKDLERKVFKYHLFCRYYKIPPRILKKQVQSLRINFLKLQDFFHYNRPKEIEFKKGSNWVSITHELLTIILAQKSFILRRFKNVCCGDEIFLQSILWNSERRSHIYWQSCGT